MRHKLVDLNSGHSVCADDIAVLEDIMSTYDTDTAAGIRILALGDSPNAWLMYAAPVEVMVSKEVVDSDIDEMEEHHITCLDAEEFTLVALVEQLGRAGVCNPTVRTIWRQDETSYTLCPPQVKGIALDQAVALYEPASGDTKTPVTRVAVMPAGCYLAAWVGDWLEPIAFGYTPEWPDAQEFTTRLSCTRATATCGRCRTQWTGHGGDPRLVTGAIGNAVINLDNPPPSTDNGDAFHCPQKTCTGAVRLEFT